MNLLGRVRALSELLPRDELECLLQQEYKGLSKGRIELLQKVLSKKENVVLTSAEIRKLNRLEEQLISEVMLISIEGRYDRVVGAEIIRAFKKYVFVRALASTGQLDLAVYYAKKLLRKAKFYQLDELIFLLSQFLEHHYSFVIFDTQKSDTYGEVFDTSLSSILTKRKVSKLYYDFINRVVNNKSFADREEKNVYEKRIQNEMPVIDKSTSSSIVQRVFSNKYYYYLLVGDYKRSYEISNQAVLFYQANFPNVELHILLFRLMRAVSSIYLNQYDQARFDLVYLSQLNMTQGSHHWNSVWSYYFTLEMLSQNYESSATILMNITSGKALTKLDEVWLQQWRIRSAYIHFLSKIGYVDLSSAGRRRVPNFKLGKFLNEVPHYSKDKRGMNISILIAQFIILLADQKYGKLIDRAESLDKYSYRHLKNDQTLRSNCFIRMLLSLVKAEFNPIRAERYAAKYIKRLESTEMNLNEYSAEIEIIPYEQLWKIILAITKPMQRKRA